MKRRSLRVKTCEKIYSEGTVS